MQPSFSLLPTISFWSTDISPSPAMFRTAKIKQTDCYSNSVRE